MIAMAMSSRPAVLIADEPTTALDVTTQSRIIDLLDRLAEDHGTAVVLITHDLGVAAGFCERIHVMRHGRVVEEGPVDRIYTAPEHPYTQALLGAVVDLTVDVQQPIRTAAEVLERGTEPLAEAGSISAVDRARESGDVLVDVQGVSKVFTLGSGRRVTAVDDVSFQIRRGETVGLVGESGSGKSTVSKAVLALGGIDGGTVVFDGQRPHDLRGEELRRLRKRMQMVFQDPFSALNRRQTVAQIIEAPLRAHGIGTRASRAEKVRETMHRVRLDEEFAHRLPRSMSGGQCQRVSIARSLVLEPEFLVLDESVSALDVSIQAQVLNLLRELQAELGLTYLFISHDLAVIRYMSSTVAVMQQGRIVEIGARRALREPAARVHARAHGGDPHRRPGPRAPAARGGRGALAGPGRADGRGPCRARRTRRTTMTTTDQETGPSTDAAGAGAAVRSTGRRALMAGLGAVALGTAGVLASTAPAQAAPVAAGAKDVTRAESVADLARLRARDGEVAVVAGYRKPGDAGLLVYVGSENAKTKVNGGTVIAGSTTPGGCCSTTAPSTSGSSVLQDRRSRPTMRSRRW